MNYEINEHTTEKEMIIHCIRLGKKVAAKYAEKTGVPFSDLFSVVNFNIPKILPKINPKKKPASFISRSLTGYILNYLRDGSNAIHIPRKESKSYLKNQERKLYFTEDCESYNPNANPRTIAFYNYEDINEFSDVEDTQANPNYLSEINEILTPDEISILQMHYIDKVDDEFICERLLITPPHLHTLLEKLVQKIDHLKHYL